MNLHKKLLDLGFKRSDFLKLDENYRSQSMVPDNIMRKTERIDGKWTSVEVKKIHPKWNAFYQMKFNDVIKVFILLENNEISKIFMENRQIASEIYTSSRGRKINITSKGDIIKLFPREIQRDFIIGSIFN